KLETSPPGPRVRLLEAVDNTLFPADGDGFPVAIVSGNFGRAKTSQLYRLYCHYASQVPNGRPLPLLLRIKDFGMDDDAGEQAFARAAARTYKNAGFNIDAKALERRLSQPFIAFLDGDQDMDNRQAGVAINCICQITQERKNARFILALDETFVAQSSLLRDAECPVAILLVQLLTSATVAQHLNGLPDGRGVTLLKAIQQSNLFDFASVPWLLGSLLRQPNRPVLSRSGVIERAVNSNLASTNWNAGLRAMIQEVFGQVAWTLQLQKDTRLDSNELYELLSHVRGKREIPLEQLRSAAMEANVLCPSQHDGVRFTYPGFQSFWCAKYLLATGATLKGHLDDITATLGRRSRVRLWEDTLVLLSGLMSDPNTLVRRILSSSSLSSGEQTFLAATCIHEARLNAKEIVPTVSAQLLDTLVWRSTSMKERNSSVRIRATESLGLLRDPNSIPHLVSLLMEQVRMTNSGTLTFELSGLRRAALEVLLTMKEGAEAHIEMLASGPNPKPNVQCLPALIQAWMTADTDVLRTRFLKNESGIPAVISFILATLGGRDNLEFLAGQILHSEATDDTVWAIADALLTFSPLEVTELAVKAMCANPGLQPQAAYLVGKLRIAVAGDSEITFLKECLNSPSANTQGMALRALAQLGSDSHRELCETIACGQWEQLERDRAFRIPKAANDKITLSFFALQGLRFIGTQASLDRLREARIVSVAPGAEECAADLNQLSYEISEDIFWRISGGLEGDF
ncbi:MAG TPA: hypothetical protein VK638_32340, partial [Edaphobacter sp.]|nr:hypothetical protein [Edaphobacter sp.]